MDDGSFMHSPLNEVTALLDFVHWSANKHSRSSIVPAEWRLSECNSPSGRYVGSDPSPNVRQRMHDDDLRFREQFG